MKRKSSMGRTFGKRFGKPATRAVTGREDRERFLKITGAILGTTILLCISSSIWCGWKIRSGLTELEYEKVSGREQGERFLLLEKRRNQLIAKEMIEKKASVLGLKKPGPKQIIRP